MARLTVNRGGWSDPDHAAPQHDAIAYGWGEDWRAGMPTTTCSPASSPSTSGAQVKGFTRRTLTEDKIAKSLATFDAKAAAPRPRSGSNRANGGVHLLRCDPLRGS